LDLPCFHNEYVEGMAYAKKVGKPVLIDFTGWACVNCRKMEENVWPAKEVFERLSDKYVLISLYVDDKTELPEKEQSISSQSGTTKKIKTLGNKWSAMEDLGYNINSQPFYVLLDNHGKILAKPRGYTPDAKLYTKYLDEGLCRYKLRKANEEGM
jgi:thiol:disulfide interchange protein DsbD